MESDLNLRTWQWNFIYTFRVSYALVVPIFQPMWHLMIIEKYSENIGMFFNRYSYNTERRWQSMNDPPLERTAVNRVHLDRHGDVNPFGSWYSNTGNIAGEAGVPVDQQRSVSFYNNWLCCFCKIFNFILYHLLMFELFSVMITASSRAPSYLHLLRVFLEPIAFVWSSFFILLLHLIVMIAFCTYFLGQ